MIKAPIFWFKKFHPFSILLFPISLIYILIHNLNRKLKTEIKVNVPIICIGNLIIGGAGKTSVVIALRKLLNKKFDNIYVLARGYKGSHKSIHFVSKTDDFDLVGDEAVLHKQYGNVLVAKNRIDGAKACIDKNADLIILDDGFQSKHVKKDVSFIVCDSQRQFGNKMCIPSGPLRETISSGIQRTDAIIFIQRNNEKLDLNIQNKIPVFYAKRIIKTNVNIKKKIFAFCGLGNPESFFNSIMDMGFKIVKKKVFPDHYKYSHEEILELKRLANLDNLILITSEKDIQRVNKQDRKDINTISSEILFLEKKRLCDFLFRELLYKKRNSN